MGPDSPLGDLAATELLAMVLVLAATAVAASAAITLAATAAVSEAPLLLREGLRIRLTRPGPEREATETVEPAQVRAISLRLKVAMDPEDRAPEAMALPRDPPRAATLLWDKPDIA
ncbi:hypothetical protein IscW_ISCW018389 [Ixodes scapularis]|uniref:Uncharacterized protein n=1 Tax=Ixodes scapularis TaxID=6945 RepID=B7PF21_IXOSC|nr:hypothetical protein IscW_ISCW018389 [Ixodes scapularis]|eukprot:XP_002433793.1 hypothetical protein IscW_ISCW018389 [Ixodes scapularis]